MAATLFADKCAPPPPETTSHASALQTSLAGMADTYTNEASRRILLGHICHDLTPVWVGDWKEIMCNQQIQQRLAAVRPRMCRLRLTDTDHLIEIKWPGFQPRLAWKSRRWSKHEISKQRGAGPNRTAQWNTVKVAERLA